MQQEISPECKPLAVSKIIVMAALSLALLGLTETPRGSTHASTRFTIEEQMPSLRNATAWINSPALKNSELRGKVVLINFWTYTCINWLRTLPYLRTWAEKYKDDGLVVIGVHTPEFSFEKNLPNVQQAVKDMNISYPVATDNDYAIWDAFDNNFWPALYFVDAKGKIRHQQFGEGDYEGAEQMIRQLLKEAGYQVKQEPVAMAEAKGAELPADWKNLNSPENYTGYQRTENFVSPGGAVIGSRNLYRLPASLKLNEWAVSGHWTFNKEAINMSRANGKVIVRFQARDLHLVMGTATQDKQVHFRVRINGMAPGAAHGADVDEAGNGIINHQRLYQLIRQQQPVVEQKFEIEFLDPSVEVFAFTFG